jgi:hypothetical protein
MVEADRSSVVWRKPRMGGGHSPQEELTNPQIEAISVENLVKHVSTMVNKTSGVDGFCASDMKLMGAYGL